MTATAESSAAASLRYPRLRLRTLPLLMPYVYVVVFVVLILLIQPALINSEETIDGRVSLIVPLALIAYGQTFAVVTRGLDLSVGGLISVGNALLVTHLNHTGAWLALDIVGVLVLGAAIGGLNGFLVGVLRLEPFLVTLATWTVLGGVAFAILPLEGGTPSPDLVSMLTGSVVGVPKSVIVLITLFAAWIWLRRTGFFTDLLAIGSDEHRAWLAGVRVRRRKIEAYVWSGILAAAASLWVTASTGTGSPTAGDQFILASIAAVVLGGTSIFGGLGSAASSAAGAVAFMLIPTVVYALNLDSFWSICIQGIVLMLAVTVNAVVQTVGTWRTR